MIEISLGSSVSMHHNPIRQKVSGTRLLDDRLRASSNETLDDCACVPSDFSFKHIGLWTKRLAQGDGSSFMHGCHSSPYGPVPRLSASPPCRAPPVAPGAHRVRRPSSRSFPHLIRILLHGLRLRRQISLLHTLSVRISGLHGLPPLTTESYILKNQSACQVAGSEGSIGVRDCDARRARLAGRASGPNGAGLMDSQLRACSGSKGPARASFQP